MTNQTYTINQIMTIIEAAARYNVNVDTLKNKFKPSVTKPERIQAWINEGLIRRSGGAWLITETFMEMLFKK